jgi:serine/threonine-protein kinase
VLFELLCGHPPFVGDNPVSVAYQHVREDPRPPSSSNRDVTPDIDAVVLKALAKNPINRYQSAGEMRADVMRAAAGRPVSAPPVMTEDEMATMMQAPAGYRPSGPPSRQPARAAQRNKRKSSAAIVVVLVLLGVLAVAALSIGLYLVNQTPSVQVPDLTGKTAAQADAALAAQGLRGDAHPVTKDGCTSGQVIDQTPKFGQVVDKGSAVDYSICTAPNQVTVPPLIGLSVDDAKQTLKDKGLESRVATVDSVDKDKDKVVGTDPPVNTPVNPGDTVVIQVGNGNLIPLPDLKGLTRNDAIAKLREAGFTSNPKFVNTTVTDPDQDGVVQNTDQKVGQPYKKNTQVTVFIGKLDKTPVSPPPSDVSPSASAGPGPG